VYMLDQSTIEELKKTAKAMVAPGKGILAADESFGTIEKRFTKINLPSTEESRRSYRGLLFTAPGIGQYISGVIMFDETIRQSTTPFIPPLVRGDLKRNSPPILGGDRGGKDGRTFVKVLQEAGVLPGIKVDQGTKEMEQSPNEKVTKGLEGLPERLKEYVGLGAKFTKWRAVITITPPNPPLNKEGNGRGGLPTDANILQNVKDLALYAKASQGAGLVPMVEPEVLMDGSHSISKCAEVSEKTLRYLFEELEKAGVVIEGTILKTNMVVPGKESTKKVSPQEVAEATAALFKRVLPPNLPGCAFLSGGLSEVDATAFLDAMNKMGKFPWQLSFSYGRALQDSALKIWNGKAENVAAAQAKFLHRAKMNGLATLGQYSSDRENSP
jgi:fructose-bisphosphate aldolase class I